MRIGLVADTHGLFDPLLETLFRGVDEILHAGDVGTEEVLARLGALAPVRAIRGNVDERRETKRLPEFLDLELAGWRLLVLHDLGKPAKPTPGAARLITKAAPDLVLSGHSHAARLERVGDRLFVNPGGAGKKRFKLERTAGLLELSPTLARVEIFSLESPSLPLHREGEFRRAGLRRGA